MKTLFLPLVLTSFFLSACGGDGRGEIAEINNDWTGNEIKIESFEDEKGSAKMSLATVPLHGADVTWTSSEN